MEIHTGHHVHDVDGESWNLDVQVVDPKFLSLVRMAMPAGVSYVNTHTAIFSGNEGAPAITFKGTYGERTVRI